MEEPDETPEDAKLEEFSEEAGLDKDSPADESAAEELGSCEDEPADETCPEACEEKILLSEPDETLLSSARLPVKRPLIPQTIRATKSTARTTKQQKAMIRLRRTSRRV